MAMTSELMLIQPTILRFTQMLSAVLKIDVEVVDSDLVRVAGTGPYGKYFGKKLTASSKIFNHILESQQEKVVTKSRHDPLCENCQNKQSCRETAFLGIPILIDNKCIGIISIVAFTEESQKRIQENSKLFSNYIRYVSQIVISKLVNKTNENNTFDKILNNLINNMDQGVLVLDENNRAIHGNLTAFNSLNINQNILDDLEISIEMISDTNEQHEKYQNYIVSIADRQELLVGQLHNVKNHKLFLMAYYQPNKEPHTESVAQHDFSDLIGECPEIRQLKKLISRIASSPSSVLINGESGTGKEVVARAIHKLSDRKDRPFIAINCAAIPEQLLESELFGYVKGAFTGALPKGKLGLIQAANHGTLFLDEIGDMSLTLQAKLLRVLETREVMPLGSNVSETIDIRIISATNRHFSEMIVSNQFREDLYYRLNVIPIYLPALKSRKGDIELLADHFLQKHSEKIGVAAPRLSTEALLLMNRYQWPGNIRELSNLVEYLVNVVPEGEQIDTDLLPPHFEACTPPPVASEHVAPAYESLTDNGGPSHALKLEEIEKNTISEALNRLKNRNLVAQELGIGIATLYRKIKKYEL